ncbi:MAG: flagellar hook-length control protein FliK [Roseococcus sp.]|nr:flagellar hook-length control protein FliK [Roseococcus sp.]
MPRAAPELAAWAAGLAGETPEGSVRSEAAPPAPPPAPPPPARQVAPVAVALAFAPALGQFQVALDPPELGRVEIAVRREGEGHEVRVLAERPETLALLERDRAELGRALAEAGVALGEGGLRFALAGESGPGGGRGGDRGRAPAPPWRAEPASAPAAGPPSAGRGLIDLRI